MVSDTVKRDYTPVCPSSKLAGARGLASAEWYAWAIPRKRLKELMQRSEGGQAGAVYDTSAENVPTDCGPLGRQLLHAGLVERTADVIVESK